MAKVFVSTRFKKLKKMGNDPRYINRISFRYQANFFGSSPKGLIQKKDSKIPGAQGSSGMIKIINATFWVQ